MNKEELRQRKENFRCTIDIRVRVFTNGDIKIDAPEDVALFKEVMKQATQIMENSYPSQREAIKPKSNLISLH